MIVCASCGQSVSAAESEYSDTGDRLCGGCSVAAQIAGAHAWHVRAVAGGAYGGVGLAAFAWLIDPCFGFSIAANAIALGALLTVASQAEIRRSVTATQWASMVVGVGLTFALTAAKVLVSVFLRF